MSERIYSPLLHRALEFAAIKHQGQFRKHPKEKIPYISHPANVALMLMRAGYDDEAIAAGILHDVIEDCGVTKDDLTRLFNPHIAQLVEQVSEPSKDFSWQERKVAYREKLEQGPDPALAIAAADHIHNLHGLASVYRADPAVTSMFKASMPEKMEHETLCAQIISRRLGGPLAAELEQAVSELKALLKI